jgi:hypothetical protein
MKIFYFFIALLFCSESDFAQVGSFSATVTLEGGKVFKVQMVTPHYKFDAAHGYWFTNPHNGDRHFNIQPEAGYGYADAAFVTLNSKSDDINVIASDNTNEFSIRTKDYQLTLAGNGSPVHFHITTFTPSEIAFSLSGAIRFEALSGTGEAVGAGKVEGTGHFYREPRYDVTDKLPGCDCDPTIYAKTFDAENMIRTTSACEMALKNKIFDAVQKSFAGLFTKVAYTGSENPMPAGGIILRNMAGHSDVSGPAKPRPYCSSDYATNRLTGIDYHKKLYNDEDTYGVQLTKMPTPEQLNPPSNNLAYIKNLGKATDSLTKLLNAKKITPEQLNKAMMELYKPPTATTPASDFAKMDMEHNLEISVAINPLDDESTLVKIGDKSTTVSRHTIKGATFEIFTGQIKDSDGTWVRNQLVVYLGKFAAPVAGKSGAQFDALIVKTGTPVSSNKLTVNTIIVRFKGGKELIDQAEAAIDFNPLIQLLNDK